MTYGSNIYYQPEDFGLAIIGLIDWGDGNNFDQTVAWQRTDGKLVYAEDAGCSCPLPFEDATWESLTEVRPAEFQAHLNTRARENPTWDYSGEIADLMYKVMTAVSIPGKTAGETELESGH